MQPHLVSLPPGFSCDSRNKPGQVPGGPLSRNSPSNSCGLSCLTNQSCYLLSRGAPKEGGLEMTGSGRCLVSPGPPRSPKTPSSPLRRDSLVPSPTGPSGTQFSFLPHTLLHCFVSPLLSYSPVPPLLLLLLVGKLRHDLWSLQEYRLEEGTGGCSPYRLQPERSVAILL